ncbi:MAG: hypothetical protein AAF715_15275 [Myxococcota bacterium]
MHITRISALSTLALFAALAAGCGADEIAQEEANQTQATPRDLCEDTGGDFSLTEGGGLGSACAPGCIFSSWAIDFGAQEASHVCKGTACACVVQGDIYAACDAEVSGAATCACPEGTDFTSAGCIDVKSQCDATGGVYEEGACACAQDGASAYDVFVPGEGCQTPAHAIIADHYATSGTDAGSFINPDVGVNVVYRPGAIDVVGYAETAADAAALVPWVSFVSAGGCFLEANLPDFDCDDFTKQGCFFEEVEDGFSRFSDLGAALNDAFQTEMYSEYQLADIRSREVLTEIVTLDTRTGVALYWGRVDGVWSLLFIDTAAYDCSA